MDNAEFAAMINGREYREELEPGDVEILRDNNLVMITGYSDDNIELRGAICDEVGAYERTSLFISNQRGLLISQKEYIDCMEDSNLPENIKKDLLNYYTQCLHESVHITGEFDREGYSWFINMERPKDLLYSYFDLMEDGEKHTRGIILKLR